MEQEHSWQERLIPFCVEINGLPRETLTQELKDYFKRASDFQVHNDETGWTILVLFSKQKDAQDLVALGKIEIVLDDEDPEACILDIKGCCTQLCDIPLTWRNYSLEDISSSDLTNQTDVGMKMKNTASHEIRNTGNEQTKKQTPLTENIQYDDNSQIVSRPENQEGSPDKCHHYSFSPPGQDAAPIPYPGQPRISPPLVPRPYVGPGPQYPWTPGVQDPKDATPPGVTDPPPPGVPDSKDPPPPGIPDSKDPPPRGKPGSKDPWPHGGQDPNYPWSFGGRDPNRPRSPGVPNPIHPWPPDGPKGEGHFYCTLVPIGPWPYGGPFPYGPGPHRRPDPGGPGPVILPKYEGQHSKASSWYGYPGHHVHQQQFDGQHISQEQLSAQHGSPAQFSERHMGTEMLSGQHMSLLTSQQQNQLQKHGRPSEEHSVSKSNTKSSGHENKQVADDMGVHKEHNFACVNTILVSKIPKNMKAGGLKKFFESKKSSGGPVEKVYINNEKQTAIVTFQKAEVVPRVLARRPMLYKKEIIEIQEFHVESESDDESEEETSDSDSEAPEDISTIEVQGMSPNTTRDTVHYYFENKRKSGGGNIKELHFDAEKAIATITFEDISVTNEVIGKPHVIDGRTLEVKLFVPPPPVQMYEDKVLLRNVSPDTSKDALESFLELKASALPKSLIYGEEEGTILVTFDKEIDFETFTSACRKRPFEGRFLKTERVPVTNCVYVGNLNPDTTSDGLEIFFENARRSGGGDIQNVEMSDIDNFCLIFLKISKTIDIFIAVVDSVCDQRQLVLDNSTLSVHPHHTCLGQVNDGIRQTQGYKSPPSIEIQNIDKVRMYAFLYQHEKGEIDHTLEAINARIEWPKSIEDIKFSVSPTLSKTTKNVRKLAKMWNEDVLQAMLKIEKSLKIETIQILKEVWNEDFKAKIRADVSSDSSAVQVSYDDLSCEITLIGYQAQVDQKARLIDETRRNAENDLERKKKRIREEMHIDVPKLVLLRDLDTLSTISLDLPDLAITADMDKGNILFEGQRTDIKSAKVNIYEILNNICNRKMEKQFSNAALLFLKNAVVHQYLESRMKKAGIRCAWEVCPSDSCIVLYSLTQPDIVNAADLIKARVIEKSHQVDRLSMALLSENPWKKLCDDFKKKFPGLVQIEVDMTKCLVQILTLAEHRGEILETIDDFLAKNAIIQESLKLDSGVSKYLKQYKRDDIDLIEERSSNGNIKITLSDKEMIISGSRGSLTFAKPLVADLASNVKCRCFPLNKPGFQEILQSVHGEACRRDIESRRTCIIEISTTGKIESARSSHGGTDVDSQPELIATGTTKSRAVIKTYQGDITLLDVDVIVNAANCSMDHAGGLSKHIVTKGGQSIQDECTAYVNRKGNLHDGSIYFSKPGNLKCKMIAHANSPNWRGGNQREREDLDGVVWKSLEESGRKGYTSIAIPALGTGLFQYPEDKATFVIVKTILEFLEEEKKTSVSEICLCDINPTAVSCFTEELKRQLGETSVVNHKKPVQDQRTRIVQKENKDVSVKRRNVNVQIVKGQISKATTDVIVNTTSCDLQLTNGDVSNSILQAAGQSIQDECRVGYTHGIQHGNVATTTGGQLECKFIFHGALQTFTSDNAFQQFQDFIKRCLQMADEEMMTSISFPAVGTGNLSYPHDIVAAEMFKIVYEFNPTTLREVQFVINEKDARSLKAFQDEETKWPTASRDSSVPTQSDSDMTIRQKRTFTKNTGSLRHSKGGRRIPKSRNFPNPDTGMSTRSGFGGTFCKILTGISFKKLKKIEVVLIRQTDFTDVASGVERYVKSNSPGLLTGLIKGTLGMPSPDMSFRYKTEEMSSESSISLVIYGEVESFLDAAYGDIELFCDQEITEHVFEDPIIKDFSDTQRTKLDEFKESLGVEVIFEKRSPRIRLSGLPVNVKKAINEIEHMVMDIQRFQLTKEKEKITAKCVEWSVIVEDDKGSSFLPYPEVLNHTIEDDYQQQRPKTTFCDDEGTCYEIDFSAMEEYPIDDKNNRATVLRRDKLQPTKDTRLQLPPTWTPMNDQDPITVVPIQASDAEYQNVLKDFNATIGNVNTTIVKIERIQNQTLYHQYMTKKTEMDRSCSGQSEKMLWHGTVESAIDSINMYGFNRRFCGINAILWGDGVFFACNSDYSANDKYSPVNSAGQKKMYRCRVLTGDFTQGIRGMRVPPARKGHILYDSVVDNSNNPTMFMIFNDTQAYPEYLITFTK